MQGLLLGRRINARQIKYAWLPECPLPSLPLARLTRICDACRGWGSLRVSAEGSGEVRGKQECWARGSRSTVSPLRHHRGIGRGSLGPPRHMTSARPHAASLLQLRWPPGEGASRDGVGGGSHPNLGAAGSSCLLTRPGSGLGCRPFFLPPGLVLPHHLGGSLPVWPGSPPTAHRDPIVSTPADPQEVERRCRPCRAPALGASGWKQGISHDGWPRASRGRPQSGCGPGWGHCGHPQGQRRLALTHHPPGLQRFCWRGQPALWGTREAAVALRGVQVRPTWVLNLAL